MFCIIAHIRIGGVPILHIFFCHFQRKISIESGRSVIIKPTLKHIRNFSVCSWYDIDKAVDFSIHITVAQKVINSFLLLVSDMIGS